MEKEISDKIDWIKNNLPELKNFNWSFYNDAMSYMDELTWTYIYPNIKKSSPMAFVTRSKGLTGVYEIFIHNKVPKAYRAPLELHEFGHIIFTHMSLQKEAKEILIRKIMSFWNQIRTHFDDDATTPDKKSALNVARQICTSILNIAEDFEVNSRLFTKDEWTSMQYCMSISHILAEIESPSFKGDGIDEMIDWLKKPYDEQVANPIVKGCWPEDSGFPLGLDYTQYIDLILMNQDKFFNFMKNNLSGSGEKSDDEKDKSNDGNDGDNEESSADDNGKGSGNGKLSKEDIDKLRSQYSDTDEEASDNAIEEAENESESSGDESSDGENGDDNGSTSGDTDKESKSKISKSKRGNKGWSPVGHSKDTCDYEISIKNPAKLEKLIIDACFNRHVLNTLSNVMYYYNRRKYDSKTIISKMTKEDVYRPGNIYLLVDCSCSVEMVAIKSMINVVHNVSKKCGKKSRLIWWDTHLSGDYLLSKYPKSPKTFGSTWIASGIEYVRKNYLKSSNDKLIIISDFFDSLPHWVDELDKVKQDCLGICWRKSQFKSTSREEYFSQFTNQCYSRNDRTISDKIIRKLDPVFVNI